MQMCTSPPSAWPTMVFSRQLGRSGDLARKQTCPNGRDCPAGQANARLAVLSSLLDEAVGFSYIPIRPRPPCSVGRWLGWWCFNCVCLWFTYHLVPCPIRDGWRVRRPVVSHATHTRGKSWSRIIKVQFSQPFEAPMCVAVVNKRMQARQCGRFQIAGESFPSLLQS